MISDVTRSESQSTRPVCNWCFEPLDPANRDPDKAKFCQCQQCGAKFIEKVLQGRNCSRCGHSSFGDASVPPLPPTEPPERVPGDGYFSAFRTLEDKPIGASVSCLNLDYGAQIVQFRNNHDAQIVIKEMNFPAWVCYSNTREVIGRFIEPGDTFEIAFWGHVLRPDSRQTGIIRYREKPFVDRDDKNKQLEPSKCEMQFGVRSTLRYSILIPLLLFVIVQLLFSLIYLVPALTGFADRADEPDAFWFGFQRFAFFGSIPLFLFLFLSTGLVRKSIQLVRKVIGDGPYWAAMKVFGWIEQRPVGVLYRTLLLPATWMFFWLASFIAISCLDMIGMNSNGFLIAISCLVYLVLGLILVDLWFENYGVHFLVSCWRGIKSGNSWLWGLIQSMKTPGGSNNVA